MTDLHHDTEELLSAVRDAGASPEFRVLLRVEGSEGLLHRKVRACYDFHREKLSPEFPETSGHFISHLWAGDLGDAWRRADMDRTRLLLRTFSEPRLLEAVIESEGCADEDAARILQEHREMYVHDE